MRERILRVLYYSLLSALVGGPLGFLIWLVWSLLSEPEAYWVFVLLSGLALGRPWIWVGSFVGGAIGALLASLVLLRRSTPDALPAEAAKPGCLVASTACGGCGGGLLGGIFALALYTFSSLFALFFLVGVEHSTLFDEYGGPTRAALGLIWAFGGLGAALGLALGYVVGYSPTEIARMRARWRTGSGPEEDHSHF